MFVLRNNPGFIAVLATFLVLISLSAVLFNLTELVIAQHLASNNIIRSTQAYFMAESGVEDAILRIRNNMQLPSTYILSLGDNLETSVVVTDPISSSRTITSAGEDSDMFRAVTTVHNLSGDEVNFFFGAQVGNGGLTMDNNSEVQGNVFSNSSIIGTGRITGEAIVALNGNKIENMIIDGDAYVHTCVNTDVGGTLHDVSGGRVGCTASSTEELTEEIQPESLPISASQITQWKDDAEAGGTYFGDYNLTEATATIGPLKINGNLSLDNDVVLTLTGTVWVTGNITLSNNAIIELDRPEYGFNSGVLLADGVIDLSNNVIVRGSGEDGSYIMLLTTNSANPALIVSNNAEAGIFYASNGFIEISNNVELREATAYGLHLNNNAVIQYDVGIANMLFSSGPGSGWGVENWQETE